MTYTLRELNNRYGSAVRVEHADQMIADIAEALEDLDLEGLALIYQQVTGNLAGVVCDEDGNTTDQVFLVCE